MHARRHDDILMRFKLDSRIHQENPLCVCVCVSITLRVQSILIYMLLARVNKIEFYVAHLTLAMENGAHLSVVTGCA